MASGQIPGDMVTSSASGLDPDITPENALAQSTRVAQARQVSVDKVKELVQKNTGAPVLTLLGEAHVNVLELNIALDESLPLKK